MSQGPAESHSTEWHPQTPESQQHHENDSGATRQSRNNGALVPLPDASLPETAYAFDQNAEIPLLTLHEDVTSAAGFHHRKPSDAGLSLQTNVTAPSTSISTSEHQPEDQSTPGFSSATSQQRKSPPAPLASTGPSLTYKTSFGSSAPSPQSTASSPALTALNDVTPLPSPINPSQSPDLWRKVTGRPHSSSSASIERTSAGFLTPILAASSPGKKKTYPGLGSGTPPLPPVGVGLGQHSQEHGRSISEYIPDALQNVRPRTVTQPSSVVVPSTAQSQLQEQHNAPLHREAFLARERSSVEITVRDAAQSLPSPPPSNRSTSDGEEDVAQRISEQTSSLPVVVKDQLTGKVTTWLPMRVLGTGSFSEVFLASPSNDAAKDMAYASSEGYTQSSRQLVAIKIVSHRSGNDVERMDTSIKREIEILRSISHPSLPRLFGFEDNDTRALLVMNYSTGGDLFDLASQHRNLLTPSLIQRIFSELVAAVSHLHSLYIVHRDIKLENVLLNFALPTLSDTASHPSAALVTLTDLGLAKQIPRPPTSPLLTHPCGSTDYAAPEILLGQAYDGRATDAWALGVLLYALMEGRLPFDPLPEAGPGATPAARRRRRGASSVKHRIARCDWLWCELGDADGDWRGDAADAPSRCRGLAGARDAVEGLLKKVGRGRWSMETLAQSAWVQRREGV